MRTNFMSLSTPQLLSWKNMREPTLITTSTSRHRSLAIGSVIAERIAAVEHPAAAPEADHRRLQHGGEPGHFGRRILRAAAADDQRIFRSAEQLGGGLNGVVVDRRLEWRDAARSGAPARRGPRRPSRIPARQVRGGR